MRAEMFAQFIGGVILFIWNGFCIWKLTHNWWAVALGAQVLGGLIDIRDKLGKATS